MMFKNCVCDTTLLASLLIFGCVSVLSVGVHADDFGGGWQQSSVIALPRSTGIATRSAAIPRQAKIRTNAPPQLLTLSRAMEQRAPETLAGTFRISHLVDYLNDVGIPTILDELSLEDYGMPDLEEVEVRNIGLSIGSTVTEALRKFDLGWTINREMDAIMVGSKEMIEEQLITLVYDVGTLVPDDDYDTLIDLITSTIAPDSWDDVGGAASVAIYPLGRQLVVAQTYDVHRQLLRLMEGMLELARSSVLPLAGRMSGNIGGGMSTAIVTPNRPQKRGIGLPNTGSGPGSYGGMGGGMMRDAGGGFF